MPQGFLFADELPRQEGERWSDIKGGKYAVSNHGRVLCYQTGNLLDTTPAKSQDHANVNLEGECYGVHRLVIEEFGPEPPSDQHTLVNHLDGDPTNNIINNLEWVTPAQNRCHGALKQIEKYQSPEVAARKIEKWVPEVAAHIKRKTDGKGRPPALNRDEVRRAAALKQSGLTNKSIARKFEVSRTALKRLLRRHSERENNNFNYEENKLRRGQAVTQC